MHVQQDSDPNIYIQFTTQSFILISTSSSIPQSHSQKFTSNISGGRLPFRPTPAHLCFPPSHELCSFFSSHDFGELNSFDHGLDLRVQLVSIGCCGQRQKREIVQINGTSRSPPCAIGIGHGMIWISGRRKSGGRDQPKGLPKKNPLAPPPGEGNVVLLILCFLNN